MTSPGPWPLIPSQFSAGDVSLSKFYKKTLILRQRVRPPESKNFASAVPVFFVSLRWKGKRMETIYNLVPEVVVEQPKPPMYRSKHDPKAPLAGSTFGIQGTTQVRCLLRNVQKAGAP